MADDHAAADSVYDFLYVDHDRIGLFLAQFGSDGVLTEIVRESAEGSSSERGVDFKIVKLGSSDQGSSSLNRRFNARWLVPLLFLDAAKDLLHWDINTADLGSIVLATGTLCLLNTELLQDLYKSQHLQKIALRKAQEAANLAKQPFDQETARLEIDAIVGMSRQVQMHLFRANAPRLWSTLRTDGLTTPASEITMKYGNIIDGEWSVVGILDAHPGQTPDETVTVLSSRFEGQAFLQEAVAVSHGLRGTYGRPSDAFGFTPLLIFRQIARLPDLARGKPSTPKLS